MAQPNPDTRPTVAGVDTCRSIAKYETSANSNVMEPTASKTSPTQNQGCGEPESTKNISAVSAMVRYVQTASDRLRRPPRSARCPMTGAVSAMTRPASAMAIDSHVAAENGSSRSFPTESVR